MEYISSPASWFLREQTTIVGLTKLGIKAIAQKDITTVVLPAEKDGFVFNSIHDSFFQSLADNAPSVEELCIPVEILLSSYGYTNQTLFPPVCSIKKLVFFSANNVRPCHIRFAFNEALEAVDVSGIPDYSSKGGVFYNSDETGILFYPRSRTGAEYVLPETVSHILSGAFENVKHLKKLTCSKDPLHIGDKAFANSSITEFIVPSGVIKDNVASKDAFQDCRFTVPPTISAYSPEQASKLTLEALRSERLDDWPNEAFKYLKSLDDDIVDAFLNRLKNEHNRRVTIDAGLFCPLMDRLPMTRKLYELYDFLADYNNFDNTLPTKHPITVRESVEQFKLYRLTGHRGEVQRDEAFDTGCYITGHMPSKLPTAEEELKAWLKQQILEAIQAGKRLFITKKSSGVCCLAAETVIELRQQNPDIRLLLIPGTEYEYENVGYGKYDRFARGIVYDKKPTDLSLEWKPRLEAIKEQADMYFYTKGDVVSWITDHCARIITTWHTDELTQKLQERANEKGIEIVTYD